MSKKIGGFIGLVEKESQHSHSYHNTLALTTGRSCLNYIIHYTGVELIYLPYYICDSVLQPLIENGIKYKFYGVSNNLEIINPPKSLNANEMLLYVNFFGLKSEYVKTLSKNYKDKFILDNSQAFFHFGFSSSWSFNSARKFFGVADGAYLYSPFDIDNKLISGSAKYNTHYLELKSKNDSYEAYLGFLAHENKLTCEVLRVSEQSLSLLEHIDYQTTNRRRCNNFMYLQKHLSKINLLMVCDSLVGQGLQAPLYFPLLIKSKVRDFLIKDSIFIPCLWKEVILRQEKGYAFEKFLTKNLILLPIDQRYNSSHMEDIVYKIKQLCM